MKDAQFTATLASAPHALAMEAMEAITLALPGRGSDPGPLGSVEVQCPLGTTQLLTGEELVARTHVMGSGPYVVVPRDPRASVTVRSERREADLAMRRRFHAFARGTAIVAMGIFFGAALGICVTPSSARADVRHSAITTPSTPTSTMTPAAGGVRAKAAHVTSGKDRRSAQGTIRSRAR